MPSFSFSRYFVTIIDEYSVYTVVVAIKLKSEVYGEYLIYQAWLERQFSCGIKMLHSGGGVDYMEFRDYLAEYGINHTVSPPYSQNLNGTAERSNRTLMESARVMMEYACLPRLFWA